MDETRIIAAAIQFDVQNGNVKENCSRAFGQIRQVAHCGANLIVLPELWSTGYAVGKLHLLAASSTDVLAETARIAEQSSAVIICPILSMEDGRLYNSAYVIDADGKVRGAYRKIHLFPPIQEDLYFHPGQAPLVCRTTLVKIGVLLGHDLRFPGMCRALAVGQAKVVAVCAQWRVSESDHWKILLKARAIENQLFVVACNRSGSTEEHVYCGDSMIVEPRGGIMTRADSPHETISAPIDLNNLYAFRREVPSLIQRRPEAGAEAAPPNDEMPSSQPSQEASEEAKP